MKNDREDIGKLGAKGDIGFFIGYFANSVAYRVYNWRAKKIMETINVTSELELTYAPSTITPQRPSTRDLDILFDPLHNEYLGGRPSDAPRAIHAAPVILNLQAPTASIIMEPKTVKEALTDPAWIDSMQEELHQFIRLDEDVYVCQPEGFINVDHPSHVYKLKKALYGLKQVSRAWYDELSTFLFQNGFSKGTIDPMLFTKRFDEDILVDSGFELTGFSYSDYAGCKDTLKSTSGGAQFLGEKFMSWSSKKQDCTSMSVAESEYVSLSACCTQVLWMRTQLIDYGYHFDKIPIYCDSKSTIAISCNPVQHSKMKHIAVRYDFIKEHVEKGTIELYFVKTNSQLPDIFTKALPVDRFNYLVLRLGMHSLCPQELDRLAKLLHNRRDLPKETLIDRLEVLRCDIGKRSKVRMGIMQTETELTLEQTQQGPAHEFFAKKLCSTKSTLEELKIHRVRTLQVVSEPDWRTSLKKTTFLYTRLTFSVPMDSLSLQVVSAAKMPILNPNEFDLWKIRIEQYFLMTDYSLWEVILNGDSPAPTRVVKAKVKHSSSACTTTQNLAFVSSSNTDSTTESVSVAARVSAVCAKMHVSSLPNVDSLSNAVDYSFFARLDDFFIGQKEILELMVLLFWVLICLKWSVITATGRDILQGSVGSYNWSFQAEEEPANYALMAFLSLSSSSDKEVLSFLKACSKAYAQLHS
nr:retrovirus-related Pol polyprotein from transposon TNT 1-94 [Tanacetum cinerariifolium]